jgi:tetratricopeptide (TPR) repeat protein
MRVTLEIVRGTLILILLVAAGFWIMRRWWRRSQDDRSTLAAKWLISAFLLGVIFYTAHWLRTAMAAGDFSAVAAPFVFVFCGFAFSILWTRNIVNAVLRPLWQAIDGADEELEPKPLYSMARAKRARGKYVEALADVRQQLVRFPTDVEGQLLAAEILAENMNDLPGAEIAIHRFVEQPGHAPMNIAFALNMLADWHLKYAQDREGAQGALERIQQLCPDTEMANNAAQRIAHIGDMTHLLSPHDRSRVRLPRGEQHIGLLSSTEHLKPEEADPAKLALQYSEHLQTHPLDTEVREKLAVLYADHFKRLDLAADQLDQLIEQPNQPVKQVAHWLNLLADLQIRHGANHDKAWFTLSRIIEKFAGHPVADLARNRMDILKLEIKGQEKSQAIPLGSYEQNIGLKGGLPRQL